MNLMTIHNTWNTNLVVPLVVSKFHDDSVFVDPVWGIKIDSVTADGKIIAPEIYHAAIDDVNFSKIRIGTQSFVYHVRFLAFYFAKTFTRTQWELEKYSLPRSAKLIRIEYRARESDESLGPSSTLESHLVE